MNVIEKIGRWLEISQANSMEVFLIGLTLLFVIVLLSAHFKLEGKTWAVIILIISIIYGFSVLFIARNFSLRMQIVSLVICYISLILAFASIHYLVFLRNSKAYIFAESVWKEQRESTFVNLSTKLSEIEEEIVALGLLMAQADPVFEVLNSRKWVTLENISIKIHTETFVIPPGGAYISYNLQFRTAEKTFSISGEYLNDPKASAIRDLFGSKTPADLRSKIEKLLGILVSEKLKLADLIKENIPIWTYVEFLYFSTIVMTTVGLGDIVPTSTVSRLIVTMQALSGVLLTAFAFTFLWPAS